MTLAEIQTALATVKDPGTLAEYRVTLSHKYGEASDKLEQSEYAFLDWWALNRENYKSDTACENAWKATEGGKTQLHWKFTIKKIDKMMSAISSVIKVRSDEVKNFY